MFRFSPCALRRWGLLLTDEGGLGEGEDVGNERLLRAVREERGRFARLGHELGKEMYFELEEGGTLDTDS